MNWPDDFIDKVICGDCLEVMKEIPDKSIDLLLTDPPYGIGLKYGGIYQDTEPNWFELMSQFLPEAKRIANMVILPACQIKRLEWIYKTFPPDWIMCWYKGSPGHRAFIGFNDWEPHLVYGKRKNICMHDYFHVPNTEKMGNYGHPCPKPIDWAKWIIKRATKEGDLVLDCFTGSGTTAVACKELGRHFIGIEINPDYCKIAKRRLATARTHMEINFG